MTRRLSQGMLAMTLALFLAACGETSSEPATDTPSGEVPIPAGESVAELQAGAQRELGQFEAQEKRDAGIELSRGRKTIVEIAQATPELSILVDAVIRADLVGALSAPGARTVFAPTNDAFVALLGQLGVGSLDDIPVETLRTVLLSHVIPDANIRTAFFRPLDWLDVRPSTLGPLKIEVERADRAREFSVNGISIVREDIRASNGFIHVIDAVLPVPDARPTIVEAALGLAAQGQFTALVAAVVKTDLVGALSDPHANLTVFAPTDEAFAALGFTAESINALTDPAAIASLKDVLLDHVVAHEFSEPELRVFRFLRPLGGLLLRIRGDVATVNGVPIIAADAVDARNGVIHVISAVLLP